ncbi:MAG: T9SS type A sorting domain-containing protein [Paludibacteraceae bacterium]|nr:T9SS type A sorting domain-containing protein [Paludibacteraceae bacterium]
MVATPLSGYQFSHWNDGNTDNPRNITVTADATFTAYFAPGTGVESITELSNEIYSCNGQIVIAGAEDAIIRIFDMMGRLVCTTNATSNPQSIPVNASGVYMVQVDNKPAQRVVLIR